MIPSPAGTIAKPAALLLPVLLALAGCAGAPAEPPAAAPTEPPAAAPAAVVPAAYRCVLPQEQRMLVAELFFGRAIAGRGPLSEREWAAFAADTLTANFPDGFTAFDGAGQWRNPQSGKIAKEATKIVLVAAPRSPDLAGRLEAVIDAYKTRFHQQSVGMVTRDSCAAF